MHAYSPMLKDKRNCKIVKIDKYTGVKNHLSWSTGKVKFQSGQAYIFIQCPTDKYKKYSARIYYLECPALFGNRASKNLGVWTSDHVCVYV